MTTCSGCRAEILWIKTAPNGKSMPVDREKRQAWVTDSPVTSTKRVTLVDHDGTTSTGYRTDSWALGARMIVGYQSHFASCPERAQFRRR